MTDAAVRPTTPATSTRTPVGGAPTAAHSAAEAAESRIDIERVTDLLLGTWADTRREARAMLKDPIFWRDDSLGMDAHRERTLGQLHELVARKAVHRAFPKRFGGEENNGANIAGFEELVAADPSLQIKSGVQWGLFGSAVLQLGTEKHHEKWLPGIMSLEIPGAFAMTETGHGSDVAAIGTTATYDPDTEEFVIHTPFRAAWKDYLGNAALHGKAATVFAQLITRGVNHGVHCFYVPLRDDEGRFLPGIGGEDDGLKGGLNGIDNGRLHFDQVRVPRENLLNRYGDVAADGTYSSDIASPGRRFFTMLGTLVQGRVSLDGAAAWASAIGLTIAITYGNQRRQFDSGSGTPEVTLLDYGKHQRRLLPRLATTYAEIFAHDEFVQKFAAKVKTAKVGNGFEDGVNQGPLIEEAALVKVQRHVDDALAKGGKVLTGGKRLTTMGSGQFFEPTVIANARADMLCATEETFGPFAPVFRFETEQEAIDAANNTEFGLASYFYSRDVGRIFRVGEALEYGMVGINVGILATEHVPFGGVKQSGLGREGSHHGMDDYVEIKYLCLGDIQK